MVSQIHLVRHAEAVHNVTKNMNLLDPALTALGHKQSEELGQKFPHLDNVGVVVTSPLRRAIETSLSAFANIFDKSYFDPESSLGLTDGAKLILHADLQERSDLPCDTGSPSEILENDFPRLDHSTLHSGWQVKEGQYAAHDEAVSKRAKKVVGYLKGLSETLENGAKKDIVVVTHGVFMKFLSGEPDIDLPKAGWKSYHIGTDPEGQPALVAVQ